MTDNRNYRQGDVPLVPFDGRLDGFEPVETEGGWLPRLFGPGRVQLRAEVSALAEEKRILLDQFRQIEWRLSMCRTSAPDIHAAHGIAIRALGPHGGPWPDSGIFHQRRLVREDREKRLADHDRARGQAVDADSAGAQ